MASRTARPQFTSQHNSYGGPPLHIGHDPYMMTRDEAIASITGRLVEYYHPERIYLFGSEARGEAGPDSDLNFCVVVPDDAPAGLFRDGGIHSFLRAMGYPKDIVPWRRGDFGARAAHVRASLPATVVREGKLLYESRPATE